MLVVADDADHRDVYSQYLVHDGFAVETAASGPEAVAKATHMNPDVIVMDIALPVMDGYEATQILKQGSSTAPIPVIALTAHSIEYSLYAALAAGCDTYLTKPCAPADLAAIVRKVLAWKRHGVGLPAGRRL